MLKDDYKSAKQILASDEIDGLKLFIGEAHCTNCHNGPLFMNNDFHNTGVSSAQDLPEDTGRAQDRSQGGLFADANSYIFTMSKLNGRNIVEIYPLNGRKTLSQSTAGKMILVVGDGVSESITKHVIHLFAKMKVSLIGV